MTLDRNGILELTFQNNSTGKTILEKQFSKVPLFAQRALHYDEHFPNMAYLYIVSVSGGILQRDRYTINIILKENTKAHITTQGATRIYSMNTDYASQTINLTLQENSYLEFIPDQIIPYYNSRFYQKTNLNVHDSAILFYSEVITPGRVAMGESFQYDTCHISTMVTNQKNILRLADITNLNPKNQKLDSFGVLGENTIVGTIYILTKKDVKNLHQKIKDTLHDEVSVGSSIIKDDAGILVRILGKDTSLIKDVILEIARQVRKTYTGFSLHDIRKS